MEVWHETNLKPINGQKVQSEFMGEVEYMLDLDPNQPVQLQQIRIPLRSNNEKAKRKVSGTLTFEYSWQPRAKANPDEILAGALEIRIVKAENLMRIDWMKSGLADPYCSVIAHPL